MLTFLRKIRRSLIESLPRRQAGPPAGVAGGSARKYLVYAIGEILLVMIGILLALQVNNWNEHRKTRNTEHELLLNFKEEVITNQDLLIEAMSYSKKSMSGVREIVQIYQTGFLGHDSSKLDSLLGVCQWAWTYDPVMGVPISIRTSGQINTIGNPKLRLFVASFEEMVRDVQEEGELLREIIIKQFMPMVGKICKCE